MFQQRSEKNATVQSELHMVTVLQYILETSCLCASFDKVYSTAMRQWVYCSIWDSLQSSSDEGMQYSSETWSRYSTVQKEIRFGRVPQVQFRINTILYSRQYSVQSRDIAIQLGTAVQFRENVIGTLPVLHVQQGESNF